MANTSRIVPKFTPITAYEVYLLQVKGVFDNIRYDRRGIDYIPPQLGGFFGQAEAINEVVVLELTDFEVT